jgi:hypothetical protein
LITAKLVDHIRHIPNTTPLHAKEGSLGGSSSGNEAVDDCLSTGATPTGVIPGTTTLFFDVSNLPAASMLKDGPFDPIFDPILLEGLNILLCIPEGF